LNKPIILCVDDEILVLKSLKEQLKRSFEDKYELEFAESAMEAIEIIDEVGIRDSPILIIISDWLMPGIRGDQFLIDVHKRFPNIIKVLLTGQADESAIDNARKFANLHACVSKPWDERNLISVIESGLAEVKS